MVPALSYGFLVHGYSVIKGFIQPIGKFTYKRELKKMSIVLNYCIFTQQFRRLPENAAKNLKQFLDWEQGLATTSSHNYCVIFREH